MSRAMGSDLFNIWQESRPPSDNRKPIKMLTSQTNTNRIGNSYYHTNHKININKLLKTTIVLSLATIFTVQCQSSSLSSTSNILQSHQRSSTKNNNNFLVNTNTNNNNNEPSLDEQSMSAHSIDSVIESTTANLVTDNIQAILSPLIMRPIAASTCQLPPTWMGKWYQSNKEPIRVTNTDISDKGQCRDKRGDKYLFEYSKPQQQSCLVCLVINERHLNVLQYKESSCQPIPARYLNRTTNGLIIDPDHSLLDTICSDITGDAQLESLFRLDTPAIECPINGKYHFTYDNCREPQSSLESCIDKKQLNFKFSACPDMPGSESKSEVLKCYADWSEGNNYYMIGRLEHESSHQDKGKFRCFVYEKTPDGGIQMAQSLEESCYGLINANEGPKTLHLTVKQPTNHKCHFPAFIRSQSEDWLSVDNSLIYMFNQNSTKYQVKETREGNVIEEATCLQQFHHSAIPNLAAALTYPPIHPHAMPQQQAHLHHNQNQNQNHHHHSTRSSGNGQHQVLSATTTTTSSTSRRYPPSNFNQVEQSHLATRSIINDVVYLIQITKKCHTSEYCVRFYKRTNGIVQMDYFAPVPGVEGIQRCRNAYNGTLPQTQIITSTNLEYQRCPFEGAYVIEAPMENDLSYNPSNIFLCPRQSLLMAQCDHPSRLRIQSRCTTGRFSTKNLYCLGSWTASGLVRLILTDDERQRYTAWYRDYGTLQGVQNIGETTTSNYGQAMTTKSQHLLGLSSSSITTNGEMNNNIQYPIAPIIDMQIALMTNSPKAIQVRLTRKAHCSELRGYSNQGSYGGATVSSPFSSNMPNSAPMATSSAVSSANSIVIFKFPSSFISPMMILFVTLTLVFQARYRNYH